MADPNIPAAGANDPDATPEEIQHTLISHATAASDPDATPEEIQRTLTQPHGDPDASPGEVTLLRLRSEPVEALAKDQNFDPVQAFRSTEQNSTPADVDKLAKLYQIRRTAGFNAKRFASGALEIPGALWDFGAGAARALGAGYDEYVHAGDKEGEAARGKIAAASDAAGASDAQLAHSGLRKLSNLPMIGGIPGTGDALKALGSVVFGENWNPKTMTPEDWKNQLFTEAALADTHEAATKGEGPIAKALDLDAETLKNEDIVNDPQKVAQIAGAIDPVNMVPLHAVTGGPMKALAEAAAAVPGATLAGKIAAGTAKGAGKTLQVIGGAAASGAEKLKGPGAIAVAAGHANPLAALAPYAAKGVAKSIKYGGDVLAGAKDLPKPVMRLGKNVAGGAVSALPFAAAQDDEKNMLPVISVGGVIGGIGGELAHGIDKATDAAVGAKYREQTKPTVQDHAAYGRDAALDTLHTDAMRDVRKVDPGAADEVNILRALLPEAFKAAGGQGPSPEVYVLPAAAFDAAFPEAQGQQGFSDPNSNRAFIRFDGTSPESVRHEPAHILDSLLPADVKAAANEALLKAYGQDGIKAFAQQYENWFAKQSGQPPADRGLDYYLAELRTEHLSAMLRGDSLNGIPKDFSAPIRGWFEKEGLYKPSLGETPNTSTTTELGVKISPRVVNSLADFYSQSFSTPEAQAALAKLQIKPAPGQAIPPPIPATAGKATPPPIPAAKAPAAPAPLSESAADYQAQGYSAQAAADLAETAQRVNAREGRTQTETQPGLATEVPADLLDKTPSPNIPSGNPPSGLAVEPPSADLFGGWRTGRNTPVAEHPEAAVKATEDKPTVTAEELAASEPAKPAAAAAPEQKPPNLRVTPEQQAELNRTPERTDIGIQEAEAQLKNAPPEQQKAFAQIREALREPQGQVKPIEITHESIEPQNEDSAKERTARRGEQADQNAPRVTTSKLIVPTGFVAREGSPVQVTGYSPDKVLSNANQINADAVAKGAGALIPYSLDATGKFTDVAAQKFYNDLLAYNQNQANGYAGSGKTLIRPKNFEGFIPPENSGYTPIKLSEPVANYINLAMGIAPPKTARVSPSSITNLPIKPTNVRAREIAEINARPALKPGVIGDAKKQNFTDFGNVEVAEFNPLRKALDTKGVNTRGNLEVTERINLENVKSVTPKPESGFRAPVADLVAAGFMPKAEFDPQTRTEEFRKWFGGSKVVDEKGNPKVVYHGTARPDRIGTQFRKERATSGPMAFFTEDPAIASNYSIGKADTSIEDVNYSDWFKAKPAGSRSEVNIEQLWYHLPQETRAHLTEVLPHIGEEGSNDGNGTGKYAVNDEGIMAASGWPYYLRQAKGNALKAALEVWVNSGGVFGQEEKFLDVLKAAGLDNIRLDDPNAVNSGVYPAYLSIQNPLNTEAIPAKTLTALDKAASRTRKPLQRYGADLWDKNTREPRAWVDQLKSDVEKGVNSHAWSSIPDWVTRELRREGYDGIQDTGGKNGGPGHQVWVPFEPSQIKSAIGNKGTFSPESKDISFMPERPETGDEAPIRPAPETDLSGAHIRALGDQRNKIRQQFFDGMPVPPLKQNENFKTWFGDSKIVDAEGEPLKVYHGTIHDFKEPSGLTWFTDSPRVAEQYANRQAHGETADFEEAAQLGDGEISLDNIHADHITNEPLGQNVIPAYLRAKHPLDLRDLGSEATPGALFRTLKKEGIVAPNETLRDWMEYTDIEPGAQPVWKLMEALSLYDDVRKKGFDGVIIDDLDTKGIGHVSYGVFSGDQVKSATGNNGQFGENKNIAFMPSRDPDKNWLYYNGRKVESFVVSLLDGHIEAVMRPGESSGHHSIDFPKQRRAIESGKAAWVWYDRTDDKFITHSWQTDEDKLKPWIPAIREQFAKHADPQLNLHFMPGFFSQLEKSVGGLPDEIAEAPERSVKGRSVPAREIRDKDGKVIKSLGADTAEEAAEIAERLNTTHGEGTYRVFPQPGTEVWAVPITDAMRTSLKDAGQPMFMPDASEPAPEIRAARPLGSGIAIRAARNTDPKELPIRAHGVE